MALASAVAWPAGVLVAEQSLRRISMLALGVTLVIALLSLGGSWLVGKPPRSRRNVVLHVVIAGAIVALAAPFLAASLFTTATGFSAALTLAPLALLLGLPMALVSGVLFAWIALTPATTHARDARDVQPFS